MLGSRSSIEEVGADRWSTRINFTKIFADASMLKKLGASLRVAGVALCFLLAGGSHFATAQSIQVGTATGMQPRAAAPRGQVSQVPSASGLASQITSAVIPGFEVDGNPSGLFAIDQPGGATIASSQVPSGQSLAELRVLRRN